MSTYAPHFYKLICIKLYYMHNFCSNLSFLQTSNLECISCWKQERQNAVIISYRVYWIYEFYETSIVNVGEACISISITCYDGIPVSAQNSHQTIHDPSSRFRDRPQYYHERKKNLAYAFVPTFFFAKLVITLDRWPFLLNRKNSRSSEITRHCLFTKSSFSRFLWIWSSSVTLY